MKPVFLYLPFAFTLLTTVLSHRTLKQKTDEFHGVLVYFVAFCFFFMIVPVGIMMISGQNLPNFFNNIGLSIERSERIILLILAGIPLTLFIAYKSAGHPEIKKFYPFSKSILNNRKKFVIYQCAYLVLYYFTWEFLFRGLLFFPIKEKTGLILALCVQTIISTLYHIGHPDLEMTGALAGGFIYGFIAHYCHSFLPAFILHAILGITTDSLLFHRSRKQKAS